MTSHTRTLGTVIIIIIISLLILLGALAVTAQDDVEATLSPDEICRALLDNFYTQATEVCLGKPDGQICNGGNPPIAQPEGPVARSLATLGALVPANVVTALTSTAFAADGSNGGLVWLRVEEKHLGALLIGDVVLQDITFQGAEYPAWHSMVVITTQPEQDCAALPPSALVVQNSMPGLITSIAVNGISIEMLGTAMIQTEGDSTVIVVLSGEIHIFAGGQQYEMVAGQQTRIPHSPGDYTRVTGSPTQPAPFDAYRLKSFPIELLDRSTRLPQPGFVSTEAAVNLRAGPSTEYAILEQVEAGVTMTILGRNTIGDWYHVRLPWGSTGWMYAELLRRNHGVITEVYAATPMPPQRYGTYGHIGRVLAPSGANVRSAPDVNFSALFTLPEGQQVEVIARSPYSPWVKIDAAGVIGWVALITLDTQVIIESLPVDYHVPPPPEPPPATQVPGSWGGAFPDPSCYPNCN